MREECDLPLDLFISLFSQGLTSGERVLKSSMEGVQVTDVLCTNEQFLKVGKMAEV